jgi:hypothetical protein
MIIKMFWERCSEFVVEGQDGFLIEADAEETRAKILPLLSPHEKLKFEQMKDFYVAKAVSGPAREGCYYFLVSRDAQAIKFESFAFLSSDQSARGGKLWALPDIPIAQVGEVGAIDPASLG